SIVFVLFHSLLLLSPSVLATDRHCSRYKLLKLGPFLSAESLPLNFGRNRSAQHELRLRGSYIETTYIEATMLAAQATHTAVSVLVSASASASS
ncbi:hypothetical protein B0H14DRAFT_2711421, partial [Mycena olivaceomarginata]